MKQQIEGWMVCVDIAEIFWIVLTSPSGAHEKYPSHKLQNVRIL